jgi:hypothetical protein
MNRIRESEGTAAVPIGKVLAQRTKSLLVSRRIRFQAPQEVFEAAMPLKCMLDPLLAISLLEETMGIDLVRYSALRRVCASRWQLP